MRISFIALGQPIAQVGAEEVGNMRGGVSGRPQKQTGLAKVVFVGRILEELNSLGVGGSFVFAIPGQVQAGKQFLIGDYAGGR